MLSCCALQGCFLADPIIDLPRDVAILGDHARARSALARGDLRAAEDFLTAERFTHRSREVVGMSWGELTGRAAQIVLEAEARGEAVRPAPLFWAHMAASYSHDLPVALAQLQRAQALLDRGVLSEPAYKRDVIFQRQFPRLVLHRYLASGGRLDWNTSIGEGLEYLRFPAREPGPGEQDLRDFYRFPVYLTREEREWLFTRAPLRVSLDETIWRDEARLRAFTRSQDYYDWYEDNSFDWLLVTGLVEFKGPEQVCLARRRGYDVIGRSQWDARGKIDPRTCRERDLSAPSPPA